MVCREVQCLTWAPTVRWLTLITVPFVITQALQTLPATSAVWQERAEQSPPPPQHYHDAGLRGQDHGRD